jgi:hypothetical protein
MQVLFGYIMTVWSFKEMTGIPGDFLMVLLKHFFLIKADTSYHSGFRSNVEFDVVNKKIRVIVWDFFAVLANGHFYQSHPAGIQNVNYNFGNFSFEIPLNVNWNIGKDFFYRDSVTGEETSYTSLAFLYPPPDSIWLPEHVKYLPVKEGNISVFPNPANKTLNIQSKSVSMSKIFLYDLKGNLLKIFEPNDSFASQVTLDVSMLPPSEYVLGTIGGSQSYSIIVSIVR